MQRSIIAACVAAGVLGACAEGPIVDGPVGVWELDRRATIREIDRALEDRYSEMERFALEGARDDIPKIRMRLTLEDDGTIRGEMWANDEHIVETGTWSGSDDAMVIDFETDAIVVDAMPADARIEGGRLYLDYTAGSDEYDQYDLVFKPAR